MGRNDTKRIEVRATEDELEQAQEFVESLLDNPSINSEIASETEVIFEAVFSLILMQGFVERLGHRHFDGEKVEQP